MAALDAAQRYFDAWNRRDPGAIAAMFVAEGTYSDPSAGRGLRGSAIAAYAASLFAAFPDLSFEVVGAPLTRDDVVVARWVMRGTNSGPSRGGPPTGRSAALRGVDLITVQEDRIATVEGYFDRQELVEQLGLQVIVQPYALGPVGFGSSVHLASGNPSRPGAVSLTWIEVGSDADAEQVQADSRRIMPELARMKGFIGFLATRIGRRLCTITAWESPEDPRQLTRDGTHKTVMDRFFRGGFATAAQTSVWVAHRMNHLWARCSCGAMLDLNQTRDTCACGQPIPAVPAAW